MFTLTQQEDRLCLIDPDNPSIKPIYVDFNAPTLNYRRHQGGSEAIVKAIAMKGKSKLNVLDLSAGFGRDAFIIASKGHHVTMLERSTIIVKLLMDGLERAKHIKSLTPIIERLKLIDMDAKAFLTTQPDLSTFDVIYFDPMYPKRTKSANVKKEMLALQAIVGQDDDADDVFLLAQEKAKKIIVKRPTPSDWLLKHKPSYSIEGKNNRFDVYLN